MSIDSRYGYYFIGLIDLNLNIYSLLVLHLYPYTIEKNDLGSSHIDNMNRFLGDPLKTPKNIFPTKSIMGYKTVPISILQTQMSKIFYFCITVQFVKLFHLKFKSFCYSLKVP